MSPDPFSDIVGHASITRLLRHALCRPHHAYVLIGGDGLGAHAIADRFVRALLEFPSDRTLTAHPDAVLLARDPESASKQHIPIEAVRAARERVSQRPVMAKRVVAYLPEADRLNDAGANALLKMLEEPPANAVFVMVTDDASRLPATIASRSAVLRLAPVAAAAIQTWLEARGVPADQRNAAVQAADGRPGRALRWLEDAAERSAGAEAARTVDAILQAADVGKRIAALDADARRADAADDATAAWQELLARFMRAVRDHWEDHPAASITLARALTQARRHVGGPVSPRIWMELELVSSASVKTNHLLALRSKTFFTSI